MEVQWSLTSIGHLTDIHDYIARDSRQYALRMVDRITARSKQFADFPTSGQMVPEYDDPSIREVIEGPYRVIYRIDSDAIVVLAVIHGARQLPLTPPSDPSD